MTGPDSDSLDDIVRAAPARTGAIVVGVEPAPQGSRRRRIWELDDHAHCPVVGVCLPIAALRRLVDKVLGGHALHDDYELHCGVATDCKGRTPIAEAVQRELDRRFDVALRQAARLKTTEALAVWWREASAAGKDLPSAFWATLTHARCTPALTQRVLGEVHMLQHQVGIATRVDGERFEALVADNARSRASSPKRSNAAHCKARSPRGGWNSSTPS